MKLRYLRVQNNPPLQDVAINFRHEAALGRDCAIHFVVGVNGSGKSRLLQVLAKIFIELSRQSFPPYPVTLAYDLGPGTNRRTILLRHEGGSLSNAQLIEYTHVLEGYDIDWESLHESEENVRMRYKDRQMPGSASIAHYLPRALLAYTSGASDSWERLFTFRTQQDEDAIRETLETPDLEEYPRGREVLKYSDIEERDAEQSQMAGPVSSQGTEHPLAGSLLFLSAKDIKLALCAVALDQAVKEFRDEIPTETDEHKFIERINRSAIEGERMPGLRGILNAVGWLWPVTIGFRLAWRKEDFTERQRDTITREKMARLYDISASALRDPEPYGRLNLYFDLRRRVERDDRDASAAAELIEILGGPDATPFSVYSQLRSWRREGLLNDVTMMVRKLNVSDLLLYDWLSDGERVFLGRMALFHLLRDKEGAGHGDALLLLDEPETHFNDVWKREIVDIIDESLGNVASNVVITTHSSIALTDVFDTEISVLKKRSSDGTVYVESAAMDTFGASPTEIMRGIFGAQDSVGQRAAQFLDLVLAVAAHPDQAENVWRMNGNADEIRSSADFQMLWGFVKDLPHHYESEDRLLDALISVRGYAQEVEGKTEVSVMDALTALQNRLGPGYYQFEFRRRLRALKERDSNAPSN